MSAAPAPLHACQLDDDGERITCTVGGCTLAQRPVQRPAGYRDIGAVVRRYHRLRLSC